MSDIQDFIKSNRFRLVLRWLSGILLGLFALAATEDLIRYERPPDIAPYMERYAQLQPYLRDYPVVGYVGDTTSWELSMRTKIVQYTLVPVLVDLTPHCCDMLIGDFATAAPPEDYAIEHDFGDGLYLLRERPASQ